MQAGKHIFIEKPIANSLSEAQEITEMAKKHQVLGQVGHVERFNPAFKAVADSITHPKFIESHRLAEFNPRGTDVPVVLDLMIHDLDILLSIVNAKVKSVSASGVAVISSTPISPMPVLNLKTAVWPTSPPVEFPLKKCEKPDFSKKTLISPSIFLEKKVEVVKMKDAPEKSEDFAMILQNAEGEKSKSTFENPQVEDSNAILEELESFADAIHHKKDPVVSLKNGTDSLELAYRVIDAYSH